MKGIWSFLLGVCLPLYACGWIGEKVWNRGWDWNTAALEWSHPHDSSALGKILILISVGALSVAAFSAWHLLRRISAPGIPRKKGITLLLSGTLASVVAPLAGYISSDLNQDNLRVVVADRAYRSGQMNPGRLAGTIKRYDIKSILNLRGENLTKDWHQAEVATAAKLNVTHFDWSLSSGKDLSVEQMNTLVELLRQAPKPVLIHCAGGSDRTGLVSALYLFALEGRNPAEADNELSALNGHLPLIRPKVIAMDHSFARYVSNQLARADTPPAH
jgi:protein tyrosine/serine phosphatase